MALEQGGEFRQALLRGAEDLGVVETLPPPPRFAGGPRRSGPAPSRGGLVPPRVLALAFSTESGGARYLGARSVAGTRTAAHLPRLMNLSRAFTKEAGAPNSTWTVPVATPSTPIDVAIHSNRTGVCRFAGIPTRTGLRANLQSQPLRRGPPLGQHAPF